MKVTDMPFSRKTDEQSVVHPYNGTYFSSEKKLVKQEKTQRALIAYFLVKEASLKKL